MKKLFGIIITLVLLFSLSGCCKENEKNMAFTEEYKYYLDDTIIADKGWDWFDKTKYEEALNNHVFEKVDYEEIKQTMEGKDKTVIYFGFNPNFYQCPYCVVCLPIANEAAKISKIDKILYLDIYQMRTDNTEEYQWIYNFILGQHPEFGTRISVPTYIVVENGKVLSYHIATLKYIAEDGTSKFYKGMTEEQTTELKNIYIDMFK